MNDEIYNNFWKVIGQERPSGFEETYPHLLANYKEARANILAAGGADANAKVAELRQAFLAIGGPRPHGNVAASRLAEILPSQRILQLETGNTFSERIGAATEGWLARASQNIKGFRARSKALMPTKPISIGEPMAETTNLVRGAALAPIPDSTHVILTAVQMARLQPPPIPTTLRAAPVAPARVAQAPVLTDVVEEVLPDIHQKIKRGKSPIGEQIRDAFSTMRRAGSEALGKLKGRFTKTPTTEPIIEPAAEAAASEIAHTHTAIDNVATFPERQAAVRAASGEKLEAARAAEAERLATFPERQAAVRAASDARIAAAKAVQAEAAASLPTRIAQAGKTARASFQAPKGNVWQRFSANTANLVEHLTTPFATRFGTKDPYKILGITPHTSQTAAMEAFQTKLSVLGDKRITSPKAQRQMAQLHEAYEAVYDNLLQRPKFTPPAIQEPVRTSKMQSAINRIKSIFKGKPTPDAAMAKTAANAVAPEEIKLLAGPAAEIVEDLAKSPASLQHGGKLLLAGAGVVAAAAVGYLASRKPEKQPAPLILRPRRQNWAESVQPVTTGDIQR